MTMTVSTRIKGKSASLAAGQRRHDLRLGRIPKYVAIGKIKDNSIILKTPLESRIRRECEELRALQEHERAMKSDAAIVTVGIITFGKKAQPIIRSLPKEEQDAIYKDIAERIAKKGDTKLLGLVVHRDESAPHAHYTLRGVNNQGFPMSEVFKAQQTKELQDLAAQVLADHGHGEIKRGKPKKDRMRDGEPTANWVNRTVHELHVDMPAELAAIKAERDEARAERDQFRLERDEARAERDKANAKLELIYDNQGAAENRLKEMNEEIKQGYSEIDFIKNLKAKEKADFEKYQQYITNTKQNNKLDEERRKKRIETYEKRMQNAIDNFAKLNAAPPDKVREALENAGIIEPQEVIFAGAENEEPELSVQVNHDLDWD